MTLHKHNIAALLFDLGGVLIELTGIQSMIKFTNNNYTEEQLWQMWVQSSAGHDFERDMISPMKFAERIIEEFGISIAPDVFLEDFKTWAQKPFPNAEAILQKLAGKQLVLACLSNTNRLHWDYLVRNTGLLKYFTHLFPSHLTGLLKPSLESFANAVSKINLPPESILYVDDNSDNVAVAANLGLAAFRVSGAMELEDLLSQHNLL